MSSEWGEPVRIFLATQPNRYYTIAVRSVLIVVEGQTTHLFTDNVNQADLIIVDSLTEMKRYEGLNKVLAYIVLGRESLPVKPGVRTLYLGNFLIALKDLIKEIQIKRFSLAVAVTHPSRPSAF